MRQNRLLFVAKKKHFDCTVTYVLSVCKLRAIPYVPFYVECQFSVIFAIIIIFIENMLKLSSLCCGNWCFIWVVALVQCHLLLATHQENAANNRMDIATCLGKP